jgi:alpha-D-ribose 1-methylphosphonate 5-triphosphate diphosphatase
MNEQIRTHKQTLAAIELQVAGPARVPAGRYDLRILNARVLIGDALMETTVETTTSGGLIASIGRGSGAARILDAEGLLVLPGIVDVHGDAFERQMMPRPRVDFPVDVALIDSDRQAVANGITTVFHAVTWSWEPGLRGPESARAMLAGIERLRPRLAADTRFHLRHEVYNLDAESEILGWIADRRIDVLAFNDHMAMTTEALARPEKVARMVERAGITRAAFDALVQRLSARTHEVPGSIERLAAAAVARGVPLLSHDDASPAQRRWFRDLGCRVAEFPINLETTQEAAVGGDAIVLGAPNVVRGGSHTGWTKASDMIERGLCTVLASDYYYPAPLLAAFHLADQDILPLEKAWALVAERPAAAIGLSDRGLVDEGKRADLILVDARDGRPQVVATIVAGRLAYLTDGARLVN